MPHFSYLLHFWNAGLSSEIRSKTASIAELNNSTIRASKRTAPISARSIEETAIEKLIGIRIRLINTI